jgi:hypothetical protein
LSAARDELCLTVLELQDAIEAISGIEAKMQALQEPQEWPEEAVQALESMEQELGLAIQQRLALVKLLQEKGME